MREMLESMLAATEMAIDRVNDYRLGGGLERIAETADEMRKLTALQVNLILELIQVTTPETISWNEIIESGSASQNSALHKHF